MIYQFSYCKQCMQWQKKEINKRYKNYQFFINLTLISPWLNPCINRFAQTIFPGFEGSLQYSKSIRGLSTVISIRKMKQVATHQNFLSAAAPHLLPEQHPELFSQTNSVSLITHI